MIYGIQANLNLSREPGPIAKQADTRTRNCIKNRQKGALLSRQLSDLPIICHSAALTAAMGSHTLISFDSERY